jgi:Holliday junction resolvase
LRIVGSQIETKGIFSLARIFTNLRRCRLQIENLEKLIFFNKKWPSDPRIGCKSPSNLLEFLKRDMELKEEF